MEVKRLEGHYSQTATPLIFGCDANTHHTLWGSMDKNQRVADLQDYLASTNLDIDNVGKKPTFRISTSAKVIDITLCLTSIVNQIWLSKLGAPSRRIPFGITIPRYWTWPNTM